MAEATGCCTIHRGILTARISYFHDTMTTAIEIGAQSLTDQLSRVQTDILQATRNLKRQEAVHLVQKLSALEVSVANLQKECQQIAEKRNGIVRETLERQVENVLQVKKVRWHDCFGTSLAVCWKFFPLLC